MSPKLRLIAKAVEIRLDQGESLDDILNSYPRLTEKEKKEIKKYLED